MKYISIILLFTACATESKRHPDHEQKIKEVDSLMSVLAIFKASYDSAVKAPCDTVYIEKIIYKSVENLYIGGGH